MVQGLPELNTERFLFAPEQPIPTQLRGIGVKQNMKCVHHSDAEAVGSCAKCGGGLCQQCFSSSAYTWDGKPMCHNCNLSTMNDLLATSKKEMIGGAFRGIVNAVFIIIGLAVYSSTHDVGSLIFWCGLGGFPAAWRSMRRDSTDHVRMGVEQAGGDWSGTFIYWVIRVILSFVFGCLVSPVFVLVSAYKTWKAWSRMKSLQQEIAHFK